MFSFLVFLFLLVMHHRTQTNQASLAQVCHDVFLLLINVVDKFGRFFKYLWYDKST